MKENQRQKALNKRKAWAQAYPQWIDEANFKICHRLASMMPFPPTQILAGYWPLPFEVNIQPFMVRAVREDITCSLPRITPEKRMVFSAWKETDALEKNCNIIWAPLSDKPVLEPHIILTPLLAFTRKGMRLGYGKGHYDEALAVLRKKYPLCAIGIAFSFQEIEDLCTEPHDQKLDLIITEKETLICAS